MTEAAAKPPDRLRSLDATRGLVIALMLLVNLTWDRDALPAQLFHVPWNDPAQGATVTDLVFPWFVFIAGAAAPFSLRGGRMRGLGPGRVLFAVAKRAAALYLLGVLLTVASFAHERPLTWSMLLSWNILQLIGAAYLVTTAVWLTPAPWRVAFVVAVLVGKGALLTLLPWEAVTAVVTPRPPDGAPVGPGTWAHFDAIKQYVNREFVPAPTLVDRLLGWLGMAQQYLPLAAIGVLGGFAATTLDRGRDRVAALRVTAAGAALVALGFLLQAGYRPEGGGLLGPATAPFSKWLLTPSYCLLAAGAGALLLAGVFAWVDLRKGSPLRPLQAMGRNALAIYVGAELSFKLVVSKWLLPLPNGGQDTIAAASQAWLLQATGSPAAASLGVALAWVALWTAIAWRMDARGVYLRV